MKYHLAAPLLIALVSSPVRAQEASPSVTTEAPLPASVTQPQQFAETATIANMFEIKTSQVALEKATSPATKTFAQHMIDDHTKAGEEMQPAADGEGVDLPGALDPQHQAKLDELTGSSGDAFDKAYLEEQLAAHEEAVALFKNYAADGPPGTLKEFAAKTLPTLQAHLEEVQKLTAK
jgi:putative membrane protein